MASSARHHGRPKAIMSWSGGKDSALALYDVLRAEELDVVALQTTVSAEHRRVSHHGIRETLLDHQAAAIGLPLAKTMLPSGPNACDNALYEEIMRSALQPFVDQGVTRVIFGDIFLEDLREYRERNLAQVGMTVEFPLWRRDTRQLVNAWQELGFRAVVCCAESMLDASYVGVELDDVFLNRLPKRVDPCGENGEFHSFVFDGPLFSEPIRVIVGETLTRDDRFYVDLTTPTCASKADTEIPPV